MKTDYLIVGSGLTGAVIARALADAGRQVVVVDRRSHVGGNVHDHVHRSGARVHTYGPHSFRTGSRAVWEYMNRFADFYRYETVIKTWVDGAYENWPIVASYVRRTVGENWTPEFSGKPGNFEEAALSMMPRLIYQKFVKGYTEKQWGVAARELSAELCRRFDVRADDEVRLTRHEYQGLPRQGYAAMMQNMLKGIPVVLDCDYLKERGAAEYRKMLVFTGPIDEFFGFDLGRLKYRGQRREHEYRADVDYVQPYWQVNDPTPVAEGGGSHIRTLEWKWAMLPEDQAKVRGTVVTREVPVTPTDANDFEYPFPDQANAGLYERYRERLHGRKDLLICGRLGEYRYYDMDHAVARAQMLAGRILEQ